MFDLGETRFPVRIVTVFLEFSVTFGFKKEKI